MKLTHLFLASSMWVATASAQGILFQDDFENGLGQWNVLNPTPCGFSNCDFSVTWQWIDTASPCAAWALPFPSGSHVVWLGKAPQCNFDGGASAAPRSDLAIVQSLSLPAAPGTIALRFRSTSEGEDDPVLDTRRVLLTSPALPVAVDFQFFSSNWVQETVDLTPYAGLTVNLRFEFNAGDPVFNTGHGWYIDDVVVAWDPGNITAYCAGDGTDTVCPCANPGASGRGCNNTFHTGGAGLSWSGVTSITADTFVLRGTNAVPNGPGLYYQGSATANATAPFGVAFGNGLRCAGGVTPRLEIRVADGLGASSTTVPIHVQGSDAAGDTRYYQLWYRDSPNFGTCTTGYNLSSAIAMTWLP